MGLLNFFNPDDLFNDWNHLLFAVYISLIGALIGHLKTNGSIQMPVIFIRYKKRTPAVVTEKTWFNQPKNFILSLIDFILFLVGFRMRRNKETAALKIELGFLGDLLTGIGTGVLAYSVIGISDGLDDPFILIGSSFLAGYGGFSYINSISLNSFKTRAVAAGKKIDKVVVAEANSTPSTNPNKSEELNSNDTLEVDASHAPDTYESHLDKKGINAIEQIGGGKIIATIAEKNKLDYFFQMMNDTSLTLSQRRLAKMQFDAFYSELAGRTFEI